MVTQAFHGGPSKALMGRNPRTALELIVQVEGPQFGGSDKPTQKGQRCQSSALQERINLRRKLNPLQMAKGAQHLPAQLGPYNGEPSCEVAGQLLPRQSQDRRDLRVGCDLGIGVRELDEFFST